MIVAGIPRKKAGSAPVQQVRTAARAGRWAALWRKSPYSLKIGAAIILLHLIAAALGPALVPYGPAQMGAGRPLSGVSLLHPFGLDQLGRDVFSRVVHGGHIVLLLSLSGISIGLALGALLGLFSGYLGGWFDAVVQRLLETAISIPFLVLGLIVIAAAGPAYSGSFALVILVVALVNFPRIARVARAATLEVVTRDYVTAARLRGESAWSIVRGELLPNISGVLLVEFALRAGYAPVLIGSLGFLGFGVRPPTPEWGLIMSENRQLLVIAPMTVVGPGLFLASLVIGLNMLTDGVSRLLSRTGGFGPAI